MAPKTRRLTVLGRHAINFCGQTITYTLKQSQRIRYVRFEIRPLTGLAVVIPKGFDKRQIPGLLNDRKSWILDRLARCSQPKLSCKVKNGGTIPYLGKDLKLDILTAHANPGIRLVQNRLVVNTNSSDGNLVYLLECWYRWRAEEVINQKVEKLRSRLGVGYNRVTIRGQRTRWGSCSQRGNLSFNWKLVMLPEPVIDYVIIHELSHLKEMNHSRRFWDYVTRYCPDWHERKRWLKEHEMHLNMEWSPSTPAETP